MIRDLLYSKQELWDWLEENGEPDYFASITASGTSGMALNDADGNVLFRFRSTSSSGDTYYDGASIFYIKAPSTGNNNFKNYFGFGEYHRYFHHNSSNPIVAAKCSGGIMLRSNYDNNPSLLVITKDNNGETAFITTAAYGATSYPQWLYSNIGSGACGNVFAEQYFTFTPVERNETQMVPFALAPKYGELSYTPNAFYMPIYQYNNMKCKEVVYNGSRYLMCDYFALRSDE